MQSKVPFINNLLINLVGSSATLAAALCIEVLVARIFGPTGKGHYAILIFWIATINTVFHFGFSRACIFFYQQQNEDQNSVLNLTVLFTVSAGFFVALIGNITLLFTGSPRAFNISTESLHLLLLFAPVFIGTVAISNINRALQNFIESNLVLVAFRITVALGVTTLLLFPLNNDLLIFALIAGAIVANGIGWRRLAARSNISLNLAWKWALFLRMFSYGSRAACFNFVTLINTRIDHLIIGSILGLENLGLYAAAVVLAETTNRFVSMLAEVMFPRSSSLIGDDADEFTARLLRITVTFSLVFLVVVGMMTDAITTTIFGHQFADSGVILLMLLPSGLFINIILIIGTDLSGRGRPGAVAIASIVGVLLVVGGNLLFTPTYGIKAAAAVAVLANFVTMTICVLFHINASTNSLSDMFFIKVHDVRLICTKLSEIPVLSRMTSQNIPYNRRN